jgi:hypothetical protein
MSGLTPERWRRLGPLLDQVFEAPASERQAVVSSLAGGDPKLLQQGHLRWRATSDPSLHREARSIGANGATGDAPDRPKDES